MAEDTFLKHLKILSEVPIPIGASFITTSENDVHAQVSFAVRDHVQNTKRMVISELNFVEAIAPPTEEELNAHHSYMKPYEMIRLGPMHEVSQEVIATRISPSGLLQATLRERSGENGKKNRSVEIWNLTYGRMEAKRDVTDAHGSFYKDDPYLSTLAFSHAEDAFIYNAEATSASLDFPSQPQIQKHYEKFRYNASFGEGYLDKKRPSLFIFRWNSHLETQSLSTVVLPNHRVAFTQAVFHPFVTDIIYATGWEHNGDDRLLAVKYCFNRPCGIWEISTTDVSQQEDPDSDLENVRQLHCEFVKLTASDLSCRSPRISSPANGDAKLVWLVCPTGGAHAATSSLQCLDLRKGQSLVDQRAVRTVLSSVWEPAESTASRTYGGSFPGFYPAPSLISNPFLSLSGTTFVVLDSVWGSRSTILLVPLDSENTFVELTPPAAEHSSYRMLMLNDPYNARVSTSWTLLGASGKDHILCADSSPILPHRLWLISAHDRRFTCISPSSRLPDTIQQLLSPDNFRIEVLPIPECYPAETLIIHPHFKKRDSDDILPCITFPHGGPHATTTTAFNPEFLVLALEGYTISQPNYTGSPGFGEKYIQALLGQCGTLDVRDCIASVQHLLKLGLAKEAPGKLFVFGGSHGGFLAGHLIGQYPDIFTAAVMVNPVISSGETAGTDIPDWYYSEFGMSYYPPLASLPASTQLSSKALFKARKDDSEKTLDSSCIWMPASTYNTLQSASPIAHVHKVKANVLLLLGESDNRVAPTQGRGYYHALRACGAVGLEQLTSDESGSKPRQQLVEMLIFPGEGHPIEGIGAYRAVLECTFDWINRVSQ